MTALFDSNGTHEVKRSTSFAGKDFIISLNADNTLSFREKGRRTEFRVHLSACHNLAIIDEAMQQYYKAKELYESRKKLGFKRMRVPKKPAVHEIFSPKYAEALRRKIS